MKLLYISYLFLLFTFSLNGKGIEHIVEENLEIIPVGMAYAVIEKGEIIQVGTQGVYSQKKGKQIKPEKHLFHLAGISSHVTSLAVLKLEEQDKLKLSNTIGDYFKDVNPKVAKIRIENLLLNKSGLPFLNIYELADSVENVDDKAMLDVLKDNEIRVKSQGKGISFSPFNFFILSKIVEQVTGESFEDYVEDHIFKELDLKRSEVKTNNEKIRRAVTGYTTIGDVPKEDVYQEKISFSGSRNIYMPITEYAGLIAAFDRGEVVSEDMLNRIFKFRYYPGQLMFPAYGWILEFNKNKKRIATIKGPDRGFTNYVVRSDKEDITVVVFTNQSSIFKLRNLAFSILNEYSEYDFILDE